MDTPQDDQQQSGQQHSQQVSHVSDDQTASQQQFGQHDVEKKEETPISVPSVSREGEPTGVARSEAGVSASVPEIEISPELHQETGVEAVHETPQLTPADTQVGIQHAKESVPVSVASAGTITLPMTQQQAQQTVKSHKKVKDSLFWLAMLIMRQWQLAQKKK